MRPLLTKDSVLPLLVFAVGVLATMLTWSVFRHQIEKAELLRFNRYSDRVINTIQERLYDHERLLEGGRGLFYASKSVEFNEWSAYVNTQNLNLYPGILGLGYIYPVQRADVPTFVTGIRKQAPTFEVKTTGYLPDLFVITQIEPVARNREAQGLDIGQEENRREAAEDARASGKATLTRRITLVQDQKKIAGFLMLLPMYRTHQAPPTRAEREQQFLGWVYVPIRIEELMQGIVDKTERMVDFEVIDGESTNKRDLLFDADGHIAENADAVIQDRHFEMRMFHKQTRIETQERVWTLYTSSRPEFEQTAAHAHWVFPVGLLLSLMAALAMWSLVNARRRAQALADSMTIEVRERESRLHAILDSVVDAILVIDNSGRITSCNQATERIFGYSAAEIMGGNVSMLMPEPYRGGHAGYLRHYLETHEARVIGKARELTGQRKDGSTFPIELAVASILVKGELMFTGIVRDITERKKVDRMKNEFISTVSHELRTPLTSIRGSLGLVAGGAVGEMTDKMQQLIDIAYSNSERLIRLINDILDIEKIESGKIQVELSTQPLLPLIEQAMAANHAYAEQYGVRFALAHTLTGAAVVQVDTDRFMQIMANLLSNAAKFSPPQGVVTIDVRLQEDTVRIAVSDQGSGIPEAFRDKIFQKFTQADSSDTRQKGGTGLGLAISKALVEHMHGTIGYESASQGTTFYIVLPVHLNKAVEGIV